MKPTCTSTMINSSDIRKAIANTEVDKFKLSLRIGYSSQQEI